MKNKQKQIVKYQLDSLNNLNKGGNMKFFGEFYNKIIWAIASVLLIACGYVAILNIWLKPKPIPVTATQSNLPAATNNKSQTNSISTNQTDSNQTKAKENPSSEDNLIRALAPANEVNLINPKQLEKGGTLSLFPTYHSPLRNAPHKIITNTNTLINQEATQELNGFFKVPEDGFYHFKVYGLNNRAFSQYEKTRAFARINGVAINNNSNSIYLTEGWHHFTFEFTYYYKPGFRGNLNSFIDFDKLAFKWREKEDKSFENIELWSFAK